MPAANAPGRWKRSAPSPVARATSTQEPPRELFEAIVPRLLGFDEHHLHVRAQSRLSPVVSGRAFGELRLVHARRLEQGARSDPIELRIISWGQVVIAAGHLAFRVVSQKCS